ncbi:MAG: nitroreductase family deazaflavin-dependent oxidoreductase [Chloroflexi bacterium]|nr:nitroreductase family deazaflavin-dependent oxidoreductase [Chloroflexota bacterium]
MPQPNLFIRLSNPLIALVLRSPLHGMLSSNTLLITVKGRKSGKTYTTPVNYLQDGNSLYILSSNERTWWRNLRGGSAVTLLLKGTEVSGKGMVIEDAGGITEGLRTCLQLAPAYARFLGVKMVDEGKPIDQDLLKAARSRVIVKVDLA